MIRYCRQLIAIFFINQTFGFFDIKSNDQNLLHCPIQLNQNLFLPFKFEGNWMLETIFIYSRPNLRPALNPMTVNLLGILVSTKGTTLCTHNLGSMFIENLSFINTLFP